MSHSPSEPNPRDEAKADYLAAWGAINRLIREGFSWSGHERNVLLVNRAGQDFVDGSAWSGFDWQDDGRALTPLDWDFDGDLDLVLTARTGPRLRIVENRRQADQGSGPTAPFLALRPRGTRTNPDGIGARVRVRLAPGADGEPLELLAARRAGEGFLSQRSAWLHFGIAQRDLQAVSVEWPGGESESFEGVTVNGFFDLVEGSGRAQRFEPPQSPFPARVAAAEPSQVEPGLVETGRSRVVLGAPVALPTLRLERSDGEPGTLFGIRQGGQGKGIGTPVVLHLFASWCAPCHAELAASEARRADWEAAGVVRVALSADLEPDDSQAGNSQAGSGSPSDAPAGDRAAARELLERIEWSGVWGFATEDALGILDALHGALLDTESRLPLPATLLIDAEGRLVALYRGTVEPATLFEDLQIAQLPAESDRRQWATPFAGIWHGPSFGPDWPYLESFALKRGLPMTAREFHIAQFQVLQTSVAELHYKIGRTHAERGEFDLAIGAFKQTVEADPYFFAGWHDLAKALHFSDRFEEAVVAYDRALQLAPNHSETVRDRALALFALGDSEGVERALVMLAAQNPEMAAELAQRIADHSEGR